MRLVWVILAAPVFVTVDPWKSWLVALFCIGVALCRWWRRTSGAGLSTAEFIASANGRR